MATKAADNVKLGILVIIGMVLLMAALYYVGLRQNLFGSSMTLKVIFTDVSGLQEGNNVRFSGINIGSVKSVSITSDTTILVTMRVDEDVKRFIRKNATVTIGSDGLMGNRLLNINPGTSSAPPVEEGDILASRRTVSTDEILETVHATSTNAAVITEELTRTVSRINKGEGTIGMLLNDKDLVDQLKSTVNHAHSATQNAANLTREMSSMINSARNGKGPLGTMLTDTAMAGSLRQTVTNLRLTSERTAAVSDSLSQLIDKASNGKGSISAALNDTTMSRDLKESMKNIRQVTDGLNEIMGNVKESPAMRSIHKQRKKKEEKKTS